MRFLIAKVAAATLLLSALPRGASAFDCCQTAGGSCPPGYHMFGRTGGGGTLCSKDGQATICTGMSTNDYPSCPATPSSTPATPPATPAAPASPSSGTCSSASGVCVCSGSCPGELSILKLT